MPMDFSHLHNRLDGKRSTDGDYDVYAAALTNAIETFQMVRLAQDETLSDKQRQISTRVCLSLMPGLNAEAYMDASLSLQEEAISDKLKEIWESAKVWASKLWDGLVSLFKKAEAVYDNVMDKLDRRLSGEYVEVNFPVKEVFDALKKVPGKIAELAKKAKEAIKDAKLMEKWEKAQTELKAYITNLLSKGDKKMSKESIGGAIKRWTIADLKAGIKTIESIFHALTLNKEKSKLAWDEGTEFLNEREKATDDLADEIKEAYMSVNKGIGDLWKSFTSTSTDAAKQIEKAI